MPADYADKAMCWAERTMAASVRVCVICEIRVKGDLFLVVNNYCRSGVNEMQLPNNL